MPPKKKQSSEEESLTRIAIVNKDKCKPKKCRQVRIALLWCRGVPEDVSTDKGLLLFLL